MPRGQKLGNRAVDAWCTNQRKSHKDGELSTDRTTRLEALPKWSWDPKIDDWNAAFNTLVAYQRKHGHIQVPKDLMLDDGRLLYSWIGNQRDRNRRGKVSNERKKLLESIPGWSWDFYADEWRANYDRVLAYATKHHKMPDKSLKGSSGSDLAQWVMTNRIRYRDRTMPSDQVALLNKIPGWSWDPQAESEQVWLEALKQYARVHGHMRVPGSYVTQDGLRLGSWVTQKRIRYKNGTLKKEWVERLSAMDGWVWNKYEWQWTHAYEVVRKVASQQGHCVFAKDRVVDGVTLGTWAQTQRSDAAKGKLGPEKWQLLEAIVGWEWSTKSVAYRLRTKSVPKGHAKQ
jgi:hypothetical protein